MDFEDIKRINELLPDDLQKKLLKLILVTTSNTYKDDIMRHIKNWEMSCPLDNMVMYFVGKFLNTIAANFMKYEDGLNLSQAAESVKLAIKKLHDEMSAINPSDILH